MTNGNSTYVKIMKVSEFEPHSKPIDITAKMTEADSEAIPRMFMRHETTDATNINPQPVFSSIARTCTHQGCNVLSGGPWGFANEPIVYATVNQDGSTRSVIECPCHGTRFDLLTGEKVRNPESGTATNLATFATKIEDVDGEQHVFVALDPQSGDGNGT